MHACDNCLKPAGPQNRLLLEVKIKDREVLLSVYCDAIMHPDDPIHLCYLCLRDILIKAKESDKKQIGFRG